jgi:hypothetical protein
MHTAGAIREDRVYAGGGGVKRVALEGGGADYVLPAPLRACATPAPIVGRGESKG